MKKITLLSLLGFSTSFSTFAQTDSLSIFDMKIEDLMNVQVVTASKKSESAFDAALTIGSVNREEIQKSGITSIPEALRLIPGVIVREVTNGNYDIHLRGLDGLAPSTALNNASNTITLVMIDNRPVYNYFNGGTFWETLPVDLNDVDRIEVVRGASSALYGPNAAAGVINIITRKANKEGVSVLVNAQTGIKSAIVSNTSIGYRKDKFSAIISGNYQKRQRTETLYYEWSHDKKVDANYLNTYYPGGQLTDLKGQANAKNRYPDPTLAQDKLGYNVFLNYEIDSEHNKAVSLTAGGQNSVAQKAFTDNLSTPLTFINSNSHYIDSRLKFGNLNAMGSFQSGTQDISKAISGYKLDFNTLDAVAEYDIKINRLSIKPGLNFRNAVYDDSKYADISKQEGFINGKKSLSNIAGSLRAEYNPIDVFKIIAATRIDKYNFPDKIYTSYQFASSYKITNNNLIRAVYSRSFRGPTFYDIYNTQSIPVGDINLGPGFSLPGYAVLAGNKKIHLLKIDLIEIGYRTRITENFHIDADAFVQYSSDYSQPIGGVNAPSPDFTRVNIPQDIQNVPLSATQTGITISANWVISKFQFKPFITFQQTQLKGVSRYRNSELSDSLKNYKNTYDTANLHTPTAYGGFYLNYAINKVVNFNLTGYYFSAQTYSNLFSNFDPDLRPNGVQQIDGKLILNAKLSYKPIQQLEIFTSLRNALNQTSFEFAQTDKTNMVVLFGASFNY
jgi:iron complex outermembrane receptor protein